MVLLRLNWGVSEQAGLCKQPKRRKMKASGGVFQFQKLLGNSPSLIFQCGKLNLWAL